MPLQTLASRSKINGQSGAEMHLAGRAPGRPARSAGARLSFISGLSRLRA